MPALGQAWTRPRPVRRGNCSSRFDGRRRGLAVDAMEDFRDATAASGPSARSCWGCSSHPPANKDGRAWRAAEISEKITDGAEIAGAVALYVKVATRWLGKAGKAGKAAGAAAMARNHTVAEEGVEEVVDDEVVEDDEERTRSRRRRPRRRRWWSHHLRRSWRWRRGGAASSPGGGGGCEEDAVAAGPSDRPDVVDEDDDRGDAEPGRGRRSRDERA